MRSARALNDMPLVLMRAAIWINYGSPGDHEARTGTT